MIQLLELLPYLVFGIVYFLLNKKIITIGNNENLIVATSFLLVLVIICSIMLFFIQKKKLSAMQYLMLIVTIIFSSLTLLVNKEIIKWKITIINAVFGIILMKGYFGKKYFLKIFLESHLKLLEDAWKTLTLMWASFFIFMSVLNATLILCASEAVWVAFKSFYSIPITIIFTIIQTVFLVKNVATESKEQE